LVKNSNKIKYEDGNVVKITADFYSLKHSFLDSLPKNIAMLVASHTNSKTTAIYRVNEAKNQREELKNLKIDTAHFS
jgi:DNA-binding transcriptional regulator WhiA